MSVPPPTETKPTPAAATQASPRSKTAVLWAVIACLLLGSSAAVRAVQDRRHKDEASYLEQCPFPLDKIPRTLGHWTNSDGDQKLDSRTMLITGGKEHIIRTYLDDSTGVKLVVLVLFGPVEPVIPHTPEVCYPANGFSNVEEPINRLIRFSYEDASGKTIDERKASFRSAVYRKAPLTEGVYHSFRLEGVWSPDVAGRRFPRRNPGVFKVQIQRMVATGERRDGDKYPEPIEDFLKSLLPAIEEQISLAAAKGAAKPVAAR
jgi:hypothetical protein